MTTPPDPAPVVMPADFVLIKGPGAAIYGSWLATGYVRQLSGPEYKAMGSPTNWRPATQAEADQLAAYDRALRA